MNATTIASTAYTVVRFPSLLAQATLLQKLPTENPIRLGVDKVLGTVDLLVGRALSDEELLQRGLTLVVHADTVGDAAAAFATDEPASTSALLPEVAPPAPAAVRNVEENAAPEPVVPVLEEADTDAADAAIKAVHAAAKRKPAAPKKPAAE